MSSSDIWVLGEEKPRFGAVFIAGLGWVCGARVGGLGGGLALETGTLCSRIGFILFLNRSCA